MRVCLRGLVPLAIALVGCGSQEEKSSPPPASPAPARSATPKPAKPAPEDDDGAIVIKGSSKKGADPTASDADSANADMAAQDKAAREKRAQELIDKLNAEKGSGSSSSSSGESPYDTARRLAGLLKADSFDQLESELERVNRSGRIEGDYRYRLSSVLDALAKVQALPHLDAWCAHSPSSYLAFLVRGEFLVTSAWNARSSGWAKNVTQTGWRLMGERLKRAADDLAKSCTLNPGSPLAPSRLLDVCLGASLPADQADRCFNLAVAADPLFVRAYLKRNNLNEPRWGGTNEAQLKFARDAVAAHPEEPALSVLVVAAHDDYIDFTARDKPGYLRDPAVRKDLDESRDRVLARYPRAFYCVALLAKIASLSGDGKGSFELYKKCAEMGDAESESTLAGLYRSGSGTPKDDAQAQSWYGKAADQGEPGAQLRLGEACLLGLRGHAVDLGAAREWFLRAAELDQPDALRQLGNIYARGLGAAVDTKLAFDYLLRASELGSAMAQNDLAVCYENGVGVAPNRQEALRWYQESAARGDPTGTKNLARFNAK